MAIGEFKLITISGLCNFITTGLTPLSSWLLVLEVFTRTVAKYFYADPKNQYYVKKLTISKV